MLAVVPVDRELDLKRLAAAVGGRRAVAGRPGRGANGRPATSSAGSARSASRRPLPVVVDASALEHETVFVSAGRRGLQVELAPADLVRLSSALTARHRRRDQGPG